MLERKERYLVRHGESQVGGNAASAVDSAMDSVIKLHLTLVRFGAALATPRIVKELRKGRNTWTRRTKSQVNFWMEILVAPDFTRPLLGENIKSDRPEWALTT